MPAATAHHKVIVLWEHEVRAAAKALAGLTNEALKGLSPEQVSERYQTAIDAAHAALLGAADDAAAITISRAPEPLGRKRAR